MAAFNSTRAQYVSAGFAGRIGQFLANLFHALSEWNDNRVSRNTLSKLSDRELTDIGFSRSDLDTLR